MSENSKLRGEAARVGQLEERVKALNECVLRLTKEKQELCGLVSGLREQLNEMEEEKGEARSDEKLMREKLKYVQKEKEMMTKRVEKLEGMYQSELGEIKNVEGLVKELKKQQLEVDYMRKHAEVIKKEKDELRMIIEGLKNQISMIEGQRDHFETQHDRIHQNYQTTKSEQEKIIESQKQSQYVSESLSGDLEALKSRIDVLIRQKNNLERENEDLQSRLDEHMDQLMKGEMTFGRKSRDSGQEIGSEWERVEAILREDFGAEIEKKDSPDIGELVDTLSSLGESYKKGQAGMQELEDQVMELREAKIVLLEKISEYQSREKPKDSGIHSSAIKLSETQNEYLREELSVTVSRLGESRAIVSRLEARLREEEEDKKILSEKLFECEMTVDMLKEQYEATVHRLEEELGKNGSLETRLAEMRAGNESMNANSEETYVMRTSG